MWSFPKRFAFRFFCAWFVLDSVPWPLQNIRAGQLLVGRIGTVGDRLVPWFGHRLLGIQAPIVRLINGSGDTLFHWVSLAAVAAAALLISVLWSLIDRRRLEYATAFRWLRFYVRFVLATWMLEYGVIKVLGAQFPAINAFRMIQPLGQMSPMGLLWTTLGYSRVYQAFSGLCEVTGGLLLLFGRTAGVGALVTAAVMVNVVMLNFCFDVPVKIFSTELFVEALFVALPLLPPLAKLLLLRQPVAAAPEPALLDNRFAAYGLTLLATGAALYQSGRAGVASSSRNVADEPAAFAGAWEVDDVSAAWRTLAITSWGTAAIYKAGGQVDRMRLTENAASQELVFVPRDGAGQTVSARYSMPDPLHLLLQLHLDGKPLELHLHRLRVEESLLVQRGFHWINEAPYNR
jgi:hypothetical protein